MPRINTAIRSVWGVSEIGFSIAATLETAFFLFFLTDVAQLPLAISGVIAASASAVDTVSALLAGVFIDKFHFKKGKYRPWLIIAPIIAMVSSCASPRWAATLWQASSSASVMS